jgi:hypothetical protein
MEDKPTYDTTDTEYMYPRVVDGGKVAPRTSVQILQAQCSDLRSRHFALSQWVENLEGLVMRLLKGASIAALVMALTIQPAPVQAGTWTCGPWRWTQHIHHTAGGSHIDWSRTRECWVVRGER